GLIKRDFFFKVSVQFRRAVLRLRYCELAELYASAGYDSLARPARLILQAVLVELTGKRPQVALRNVEQHYVLGIGSSDSSAAVFFRECGQPRQLISGGTASEDGHPHVVESRPVLAMDSKMSPLAVKRRERFRFERMAKLSAEAGFDFGPKSGYLPLLNQEL